MRALLSRSVSLQTTRLSLRPPWDCIGCRRIAMGGTNRLFACMPSLCSRKDRFRISCTSLEVIIRGLQRCAAELHYLRLFSVRSRPITSASVLCICSLLSARRLLGCCACSTTKTIFTADYNTIRYDTRC